MQGQVVITSISPQSGRVFGIRHGEAKTTFPVEACAVLLRDLKPGQEVLFITDRETGKALIVQPEKIVGCRGREREC